MMMKWLDDIKRREEGSWILKLEPTSDGLSLIKDGAAGQRSLSSWVEYWIEIDCPVNEGCRFYLCSSSRAVQVSPICRTHDRPLSVVEGLWLTLAVVLVSGAVGSSRPLFASL